MQTSLQTRQRPGATGLSRTTHNTSSGNSTTGLSPTEFLAHFEGVRSAGPNSWTAKAHSDQRTGSVSITLAPDGVWLIHDHAGRSTAGLLADRGLSLGDLFPRRPDDRKLTREQRKELGLQAKLSRTWAALGACLADLAVIEVGGRLVATGTLTPEDIARIGAAVTRVHELRVSVQAVLL